MNKRRPSARHLPLAVLTALLCAVGAAAGFASAQEQSELQPGELRGAVSSEFDELFPFEWGGGSLYDLKRRLAARGCMLDLLWRRDGGGEWRGYSQYRVPPSLQAEFAAQYETDIPAGTLYATCFNICTFEYQTDSVAAYDPRCRTAAEALSDDQNDASSLCTPDFDALVIEHVLPLLPRRGDLCIVHIEYDLEAGRAGDRYNTGVSATLLGQYDDMAFQIGSATRYETYPNRQPAILITSPRNPPAERRLGTMALRLHAEVHELCHAAQDWMFLQSINQHRRQPRPQHEWWDASAAGREFAATLGFRRAPGGEWTSPGAPIYRYTYGSRQPAELAAELCAVYLTERMGAPGAYSFVAYDQQRRAFFWRSDSIEFNPDWVLTPEIRRWLEKYMILAP